MAEHRIFFCEETPQIETYLRRFTFGGEGACRHDASCKAPVARGPWPVGAYLTMDRDWDRADPNWPKACEACGYEFLETDEWQAFNCRIYRRADTGEELPARRHLSELPVGAVIEAWWDSQKGPDGRALVVVTPGGLWHVDDRASNCTLPDDDEHRCWVRHGRPEDGTLHVDKNGLTCAAGAGSIVAGAFHGFLHHGVLRDC